MADISSIKLPNGSSYNIKDAAARTSLSSKAVAASWLVRERIYSATTSINRNTADVTTINVAKSGYTPICIVGHGVTGTTSSWCQTYCWSLSGTKATVSIRNYNPENNASVTSYVDILYRKN